MTKTTKQDLLKTAQKAFNLELIYLHKVESSFADDKTPYDLKGKNIDVGLDFSVGDFLESKKQKKETVIYPCNNVATFKNAQTKKVEFTVSVEYRAVYIAESEKVSEESKKIFGEGNVMYHVYPYLREFLQSHLHRMNMPSFTMPMLLPHTGEKTMDKPKDK